MWTFDKLNSPTKYALIGTACALSLSFPYAVLTHIMRMGTPDACDIKYRTWIRSVCGGKTSTESMWSFGFIRASFRRFVADYKLLLFPQPIAAVGQPAPVAKLVKLDGSVVMLSDFIDKCPSGMPLILNMGSYT